MASQLNVDYSQARPEDEPAVFSLLKDLRGDISQFDITRFYIAKINGVLVGCVRTKIFNDECLELSSLAVNKNYQGKGIGSGLVNYLLQNESTRPIFLLTEIDKLSFYNKFYFNLVEPSELPIKFKKEYNRIIDMPFTKELKVIAMVIRQ